MRELLTKTTFHLLTAPECSFSNLLIHPLSSDLRRGWNLTPSMTFGIVVDLTPYVPVFISRRTEIIRVQIPLTLLDLLFTF